MPKWIFNYKSTAYRFCLLWDTEPLTIKFCGEFPTECTILVIKCLNTILHRNFCCNLVLLSSKLRNFQYVHRSLFTWLGVSNHLLKFVAKSYGHSVYMLIYLFPHFLCLLNCVHWERSNRCIESFSFQLQRLKFLWYGF